MNLRRYSLLLLVSFLMFSSLSAQLRSEDRIRIYEAMRISKSIGDKLWRGFNESPFSMLLIMDDFEYLLDHYYQPDDFERVEYDSLLHTTIYRRPTEMNKYFRATFPFNGLNTIAMGSPENTGLNTTSWIITVIHERFHQYQYAAPRYFLEVNALDLTNGDETGMWQLNYPFPYEDEDVIRAYDDYVKSLYAAVKSIGTLDWEVRLEEFFESRNEFKSSISEDDYKYISFQWYQEGIARYTEYAFLEQMDSFEPTPEVKQIEDFIPYKEYREAFLEHHLENVIQMKLQENQRETVYDVGFAEALIIREINPEWSKNYLLRKFDLEKLYR